MSNEVTNVDFKISVTQQGAMVPFGLLTPPLPDVTKNDLIVNESSTCDSPEGINIVSKQMTEKSDGMIITLGCKSPGTIAGTGVDVPIPDTLGAVIIPAGSAKLKCDGEFAHLMGDFGVCSCSVTFTPPTPGSPVVVSGVCKFEITDSGQTKVKAK